MGRDHASPIQLLYVASDLAGEDEFHRALERQSDISVVVAAGIEAALNRISMGVDCVVISHGEGVDGVAVLESFREHTPDVPVVLLAPDDGLLASRAVAAGVSAYVPRTTTDTSRLLVQRVRSVVDDSLQIRGDGTSRMPIENLRANERLRLKERAIEEAPVGITISDAEQPDNPLIYVNDAFESLTGYSKTNTVRRNCRFLQGKESDLDAITTMRDAIDREVPVSVELVNYRKDGETFWNKVDIAPIRDEDGETTNYVGFQTDVTARKEAELEVKRERRRLKHLLNRISGLLQDVHGDLVRAVSRDSAENAVCERIAATGAYEFCWIGEKDIARDTIVANSWEGTWDIDAADLEIDLTAESIDASPIVAAYETGRVQVVDDPDELTAIVAGSSWIVGDDLKGMSAIPLVYRETLYGVLVVYTTERNALNERETIVLEALGRATATSVSALERERIITTDSVIELEFQIPDCSLFFVDLSTSYDSKVTYNGTIYRTDKSMLMFFTTDIEPSLVEEHIENHPVVEKVELVNEHDEENLFEFTVGTGSIITALAERGVRTRSITADGGMGHMSVELPSEGNVRTIVEMIQERYPTAELVARRERERPPETKQEYIGELKDTLTERQLTALQTAYVSGYYEWKRPVSGDELAETMDIARSTFHQHLRSAERKLVAELFHQ